MKAIGKVYNSAALSEEEKKKEAYSTTHPFLAIKYPQESSAN